MKKSIEGFLPLAGKHCVTNAFRQVLSFRGCRLSEEMLFGLGEGLDFVYIQLASGPLVSGRSTVGDFEAALSKNACIPLRLRRGKDAEAVHDRTKRLIDGGTPVLVYADMAFLPYLNLGNSHFGGHAVVIFGYDDETGCFLVSDRDGAASPIRTPGGPMAQDFHTVRYEDMAKARSSTFRPFPARCTYLECPDGDLSEKLPGRKAVFSAILSVCAKMLDYPAKLKGVAGIEKFSREILRWGRRSARELPDPAALRRAAMSNYFQINADGGTGGGMFRAMYGSFLTESAALTDVKALAGTGKLFADIADGWDGVGFSLEGIARSGSAEPMRKLASDISRLAASERKVYGELRNICGES